MNYPTRTWRQLGRAHYRMRVLFQEPEHPMDFTNLLQAVGKCGGLIATAVKPNEIIQMTGRLTAEEITRRRRSIQVIDQRMRPVSSIALPAGAPVTALGFTSCGRVCAATQAGEVLVYSAGESDPQASYRLVEGEDELSLCRFFSVPGCRLCVGGYSARSACFFLLYVKLENEIDIATHIVQTFQVPKNQKPVSWEVAKDTRPGSVLLEQYSRPPRKTQCLQDGDIFVNCLCQSGHVYKVKSNAASGRDSELVTQLPQCASLNSVIRIDSSGQYIAILTPVAANYVCGGGQQLREELLIKFSTRKETKDPEKDPEFDKLIHALNRNNELEPQAQHQKDGTKAILRVYDAQFQQQITEIKAMNGSHFDLYWVGDSVPAVFYKTDTAYKLTIANAKQSLDYTVGGLTSQPIMVTESDGLRVISPQQVRLLQPVHPFTAQTFAAQYAGSEPAHLLEAYQAFERQAFDADSLSRNLVERRQSLDQLLLGTLQAAEQEEGTWAELLYRAVRYFKLFTADQVPDEQRAKSNFTIQRAVSHRFDYVSVGFRGYLQAVVDGMSVNVLTHSGAVVGFSPGRVIVDAADECKFSFTDHLTDCFILSRKLSLAVQILREGGVFCTADQLRSTGIKQALRALCQVQRHACAAQICKVFELQVDDIVVDYILQVLQKHPDRSDAEMLAEISRKRPQTLSFKTLALAVVEKGRNRLARMLLEKEPSVEARVQLNLKIGDFQGAIRTALRGGDAALAHAALQMATETPGGLQQLVGLLLVDKGVLIAFFQQNRILRPDLVYSIGGSSDPQSHILLAEAQYRKARSVKQYRHGVQLLEEAVRLSQEAFDQVAEVTKALKRQNFDSINVTVKAESEAEKTLLRAQAVSGEITELDESDYCEAQTELYKSSVLCLGNIFEDSINQEIKLVEIQRELSEKVRRNLIGLSVFDTLVFLYQKQFTYQLEAQTKKSEIIALNVDEDVVKIIDELEVTNEVQQTCFLKAASSSSQYYGKVADVTSRFKRLDHFFVFKVANMINSINVAAEFVERLESPALRFRCYLLMRQDRKYVELFRALGAEKLREIYCEFYAQPGIQTVIQRLLQEVELQSLTEKAAEGSAKKPKK